MWFTMAPEVFCLFLKPMSLIIVWGLSTALVALRHPTYHSNLFLQNDRIQKDLMTSTKKKSRIDFCLTNYNIKWIKMKQWFV